MKRIYILIIILFGIAAGGLSAQDFQTAESFFNSVCQVYAAINDYVSSVVINNDGEKSSGEMLFKYPNKVRINYTDPENQVLVMDGTRFALYLPKLRVTMVQNIKNDSSSGSGGIDLMTREGLQLLKTGYKVSYLESYQSVPLDEGDNTQVIKLKMDWKTTREGFRTLEIAVDPKTRLIRRISGITRDSKLVRIDIIKMKINQNIPDSRFDFEIPPEGHVVNDFIYDTSEE